MPWRAAELAALMGGRLFDVDPDLEVSGGDTDSRRIRPGELFAALSGAHADGHDFVPDALAAGAAFAVVARPVDGPHLLVPDVRRALLAFARAARARFQGPVVGVTGSVGKTTTKDLLQGLLGGPAVVFATRGNFNTEIGIPLALLGLRREHRYAVFELGMRGPGEIRRLAALVRPGLGVVTNISHAHLGLLGSRERIAEAKAELLGAVPTHGWAVLSADDDFTPLIRLFAPRHVRTAAPAPPADLAPDRVENLGLDGWVFEVGGTVFRLGWPGEGALRAALLGLLVGRCLGLADATMAERLGALPPRPSHLAIRHVGALTIIDDTYNAAPVSVKAALDLLARVDARRRVAVLGDMLELGAEGPKLHREAGRQAAAVCDLLVTVGELALGYAEGALAAGMDPARVVRYPSVEAAGEGLPGLLEPGDALLVKGSRGLRLERLVAWLAGEGRP
jgi:UDP-N-acetylmuramoyl-tripeptide--D-alanyl-D-alanine ligase